jgi:hypothetical protein
VLYFWRSASKPEPEPKLDCNAYAVQPKRHGSISTTLMNSTVMLNSNNITDNSQRTKLMKKSLLSPFNYSLTVPKIPGTIEDYSVLQLHLQNFLKALDISCLPKYWRIFLLSNLNTTALYSTSLFILYSVYHFSTVLSPADRNATTNSLSSHKILCSQYIIPYRFIPILKEQLFIDIHSFF